MIMLIFEDGEKAVIQNIFSMVGAKARVYDVGFQDKCTLAFHRSHIAFIHYTIYNSTKSY